MPLWPPAPKATPLLRNSVQQPHGNRTPLLYVSTDSVSDAEATETRRKQDSCDEHVLQEILSPLHAPDHRCQGTESTKESEGTKQLDHSESTMGGKVAALGDRSGRAEGGLHGLRSIAACLLCQGTQVGSRVSQPVPPRQRSPPLCITQ